MNDSPLVSGLRVYAMMFGQLVQSVPPNSKWGRKPDDTLESKRRMGTISTGRFVFTEKRTIC